MRTTQFTPIAHAALVIMASLPAHSGEIVTANAIAAIVNDEVLTVGDVEALLGEQLAARKTALRQIQVELLRMPAGQPGSVAHAKRQQLMTDRKEIENAAEAVCRMALDDLIELKLIKQAAMKAYSQDPAQQRQIDEIVRRYLHRLESPDGAAEWASLRAANTGMTRQQLKNAIREDLVSSFYQRAMVEQRLSITPSALRAYYNDHVEQFQNYTRVKIRRILLKHAYHNNSIEDTRRAAQKIRERAQGGEDFALLVRTFSNGPRANTGNPANAGLFGFDEVHGLKPKLRQLAMSMKQGDVSEPIQSDIGFEIIKVEEVQPARRVAFEEVQGDIREMLMAKKREDRRADLMARLKREAHIKRLRFKH